MAKASVVPWLLTAAAGTASAVETRKTRKGVEKTTEQAEIEAETAAEATKTAATEAETAANLKRKQRAAELTTGGRAAQFKTGPLGVTRPATVGKKTLLGG
ncbi:MAG: hypothetical protein KAV87_02415 [Desulfobacteraceae bacterium]|nr:hypothetical protein [Desulfobacteraceae bacterium]